MDERGTEPGDVWGGRPPTPYGDPNALQSVGEIAAPVLAGFSITLLGVVAQAPTSLRWPGAVVLLLVGAFGLLLMAVQSAFFARQRLWTQAELSAWYTDQRLPKDLEPAFAETHRSDLRQWARWRERARITYNSGLVLLTAGVGLLAAPPGGAGTQEAFRWIAMAAALGLSAFELVWWVVPDLRAWWRRR